MQQDESETKACWAMEKTFWLEGEPAYSRDMHSDALMVFPEPTGILVGSAILESLKHAPRWTEVVMSDQQTLLAREDICVLVYRAIARREDVAYEALCGSTYARGPRGWKLVLHQQTPVASDD